MSTSGTISFVLDNEIVSIDINTSADLSPTTTVLNLLRGLTNHRGVKEGCAEGDCGACTIVLAELNNEALKYKAYDSCLIFLPMIHGKQLITVENVGTSKQPHTVQQAMVDFDGSQCGYCTPGFVMSLFSLYKNHKKPSKTVIDDALTGNLCRCTGYRSIVNAAVKSCENPGKDTFSRHEQDTMSMLKSIRDQNESIEIKTNYQKYFRPNSLSEALSIKEHNPTALIINGATDIALLVTKQNQLLEEIIDLSGIEELKEMQESETDIIYGSGTSLEEIKNHSQDYFPALYDALSVFGSLQIRNLSTLGGNLASASPIGDTPPILTAYDASVTLASVKGRRTIKVKDFITGYRTTALESSEIITEINIPIHPESVMVKWYKVSKRKDLDISSVSGSFRLKLGPGEIVEDIGLNYGGMAETTKSAEKSENYLKGKVWSRANIEIATDLLQKDFTPISDARASADGRKIMAKNILLKFWTETSGVNVDV